jgi:hypothetical protein
MDAVVRLPGGFQVEGDLIREVELREMSGEEEEIIVDQRKVEGGKGRFSRSPNERMTAILARCTTRIGELVCEDNRDPEKASQKTFWDLWHDALTGDRGVAIVRLRQLSLGDKYVFPETCPMCKREMRRVSYDLSDATIAPYFKWIEEELITQNGLDKEDLPKTFAQDAEERRISFLLQDTHEVRCPSGKIVQYRLLRRKDEDRIHDLTEKNLEAILTGIIAAHITSIDGKMLNSLKDRRLKFMSVRDRDFLRVFFDQAEGGLDTWMEIHCDSDSCGHVYSRKLDVGRPGFFIHSGA